MTKVISSILSTIGLCASCASDVQIRTLTARQYREALDADRSAVVLDVRRPDEYKAGHLPEAVSLDYLDQTAFREGMRTLDPKATYYLYCRSGKRSHAAAVLLQKKGFQVCDMQGGINAWINDGLPTVK